MKIEMEHDLNPTFSVQEWDIAFIGSSLDDRGAEALEYLKSRCKTIITIAYDSGDFDFFLDKEKVSIDNMPDRLAQYSQANVLLEATTLGFVELLVVLKSLKHCGNTSFCILYLEPGGYKRKTSKLILHKREFDLSGEVLGYKAIPGFSRILTDEVKQQVVFFVGFESSRLDRALEDYQMIDPRQSIVVFGVPAFKSGWEIDAFANNISVMSDRNISGGIHYCGANNPKSAYVVLDEIKRAVQKGEKLFIAPIGTKPTSIGSALFAVANDDVGVLYDHPTKDAGRTNEISMWNLYRIDLVDKI